MTDIVDKLKSWDRCYPGNINIELAVDEAAAEITLLRKYIEKLRTEVMSDYYEGFEEGIKAERERCAKIAESYFSVQGSYAMHIAAAIRESK